MSARALRNLLVLLAVLVALYAVLALVKGRAGPEGSPGAGPVARALESLQAAEITGIDIRGPAGESVALERGATGTGGGAGAGGGPGSAGAGGGAGWTVNGLRADSAAVQRLLTAIDEAKVGDRASTNPANHVRLGVTADSAWQVTFADAQGVELAILLGKAGPSFGSGYVRLPDQTDVFVVTGDLRSAVARPVDDWRDKTIARVDTARVRALLVTRSGAGYSIRRADSGWVVAESGAKPGAESGVEADATVVADLLSELADLRATGFFTEASGELSDAGDAEEPGKLEEPSKQEEPGQPEELELIALGASADTLLELRATERATAYEIRAAGDSVLYQLPLWRVSRVIPPFDRISPTGTAR